METARHWRIVVSSVALKRSLWRCAAIWEEAVEALSPCSATTLGLFSVQHTKVGIYL